MPTNNLEIPAWFKDQFDTSWQHVVQQRESRLKEYAVSRPFAGKRKAFNQLGEAEWREVTTRNGKTEPTDTNKYKRWLGKKLYDWVIWEDEFDQELLAEIAAPNSAQVEAAGFKWNRLIDYQMALAALGTAYEGETGTDAVTLPAGQQIAVNYVESGAAANSGLTLGKLRKANSIFGVNEADEDEPRVMVVTQNQLDDLLRITEVNSIDHNSVKALVDGKVDTFMGFKFKRVGSLPKSGSTRSCVAWVKSGLWYGMGERKTSMSVRNDLNDTMQVRLVQHFAAVRSEEKKVVEIACLES